MAPRQNVECWIWSDRRFLLLRPRPAPDGERYPPFGPLMGVTEDGETADEAVLRLLDEAGIGAGRADVTRVPADVGAETGHGHAGSVAVYVAELRQGAADHPMPMPMLAGDRYDSIDPKRPHEVLAALRLERNRTTWQAVREYQLAGGRQPADRRPAQPADVSGSAPGDSRGPADQVLLDFLAAQRAAVLAIVAGLDEEAWHRPVVPSGWTPAGLVEHLGGAEWHWFQGVVTGAEPDLPGDLDDAPPYDPTAAFVSDEPSAEIVAFYREQCSRSDAVLARTPLSARPRGRHGGPDTDQPPDVRWIVLHMIEETARHAGHLDIARELIDGRTGLGRR